MKKKAHLIAVFCFNRTEELLALIERLYQMKETGVLTEEEYSEKKKQLLNEL